MFSTHSCGIEQAFATAVFSTIEEILATYLDLVFNVKGFVVGYFDGLTSQCPPFLWPIYLNLPDATSLELARSTALRDFPIDSATSARVIFGFSLNI